jgi:L-amino acid N-acyltransferase YncA
MERRVREATREDADALAAIYAPSVTGSAVSFEETAPAPSEMERRRAEIAAWAPYLALEEGDEVLGFAYASKHRERAAYRWSVDVSVYVRADQVGRGVGRTLYRALFPLLVLQGFRAAHAGITLPNPGSVRLHEAFGFRPVGVFARTGWKQGAWHDVGWWQLELLPREDEPATILSPDVARTRPAWAAALAGAVVTGASVRATKG